MKTKTLLTIMIGTLGFAASLRAQEGGIGIGVGVGVGVGTGVGAAIDIERVPGNVVQGRRVFAAKVVFGSQATTNSWMSTGGGGSVSGISGIPRGWGSGFAQSGTVQSREFSTTVSVFNPGTNSVTFNTRGVGGAGMVTLGPLQSYSVTQSMGPVPFGIGFLVVESQAPLEVVALYQYRDERVDYQDEAWIETAAGSLFGPIFGP